MSIFHALKQAIQHFQQGQLEPAQKLLKQVLLHQPKNFDALHLMGITLALQDKPEEAVQWFCKALRLDANQALLQFNLAKALHEAGKPRDALPHHEKAVALAPANPHAWVNKGLSHHELGEFKTAESCHREALCLQPEYAEAYSNLGNALLRQRRLREALVCYEQAQAINPNIVEIWFNRGCALIDLNATQEALACLDRAREMAPERPETYAEMGRLAAKHSKPQAALTFYEQALALNPDYAEVWLNRGNALQDCGRHEDAIQSYLRAQALDPHIRKIFGNLIDAHLKICNWQDYTQRILTVQQALDAKEKICVPFGTLAYPVSPQQQKYCAESYAAELYPQTDENNFVGQAPSSKNQKLRIGYFSADFRSHPVAMLSVGLFENHDREQFEIYGFALMPADDSELGQRIRAAFDHYIDISEHNLDQALAVARAADLDIAVDLHGYTQNARTVLFSHRVAPIQVNYLGYPGTMGAPFMDYIVADATVIPTGAEQHYTEKVARLPHSFFVTSYEQQAPQGAPNRASQGLPENGFVFCCFNNTYKLTPDAFDVWMRLLQQVDNSVLWLSGRNPTAMQNLQAEAEKRGVAGERLVFATRTDTTAEHLQRHQLADLFLDTFYYNAHTTAADSLWAGVPVLTCPGQTFASRVAASLLHALDLPELVADDVVQYEAMALELATQPPKLAALKEKLVRNRLTQPLFNTAAFTRHMENAYRQMVERARQGLPPEHIHVPAP